MDRGHKMKKLISNLVCILFILVSIITTIDLCCFEKDFYSIEYKKSNTANRIGVSEEDLDKLTDVVLDYLKDKNKTMDIQLVVKGKKQEVFTDRAKSHMIDVRQLYLNTILIRNVCAVAFVLCIIYIFASKSFTFQDIFNSYKKVLIIFALLFAFIGIYALIDFSSFWTGFHQMFFDNDLWILEYNDVLVNMVNETFFFDLVIKIVLIIVSILVGVYFVLRKCVNES